MEEIVGWILSVVKRTTWSIVMSDVSTRRASGACASGAVAREESLRSRSAMESVSPSAARRAALTSSEAVTKYLNGVSGKTTVPMSLPSITTGSRRLYSRCRSTSRARTSGMAAMVETWSLTCPLVCSSPSPSCPHGTTDRNGPVHGPGVDERIAEAVRDELGDGGFSGGGGAVNGDGWMHECLLSWKWGLKPFEL